jgi:hypothetical protein
MINRMAVLKATSAYGDPMVPGAGMATSAIALVTSGPTTSQAAAARPGPNVTVTTNPPPVGVRPPGRPLPCSGPSSEPPPASGTVLAAGDTAGDGLGGGEPTTGSDDAQARRPPEREQSPTTSCRGTVVDIRLALGVIARCALTVGGNR